MGRRGGEGRGRGDGKDEGAREVEKEEQGGEADTVGNRGRAVCAVAMENRGKG